MHNESQIERIQLELSPVNQRQSMQVKDKAFRFEEFVEEGIKPGPMDPPD